MQTFAEFADSIGMKVRTGCAVCEAGDAICAEIAGAVKRGFRGIALSRYLQAQGFDVSPAMVDRHIRQGHECKPSTSTAKPKRRK